MTKVLIEEVVWFIGWNVGHRSGNLSPFLICPSAILSCTQGSGWSESKKKLHSYSSDKAHAHTRPAVRDFHLLSVSAMLAQHRPGSRLRPEISACTRAHEEESVLPDLLSLSAWSFYVLRNRNYCIQYFIITFAVKFWFSLGWSYGVIHLYATLVTTKKSQLLSV